MATREDVIAELQRKGYKGPIPQQKAQPQPTQTQPQQPQGQDINALIQSLTKAQQPTLTQNVGDALMRLGGGTPVARKQTDLGDVANLMKIQQMQNPGPEEQLKQRKLKSQTELADIKLAEAQRPREEVLQEEISGDVAKQKALQEVKQQVPTSKQREDVSKIEDAELNLKMLEQDTEKLPAGYSGVFGNIKNFFTRGESNPDLVTYNDQRPAIAVGLYRALTGDTRLSDADAAARALPLIWDSDEGPSVRKQKFSKIRELINARKSKVKSGDYVTTPEGDFVTPLESLGTSGIVGNGGGDELSSIDAELAQINAQLGQ